MKVLFLLHHFLPEYPSGVEVYTYRLAQEFRKRHDVVLFFSTETPPTAPDYSLRDGIFEGLVFRAIVSRGQQARSFAESYLNPAISAAFAEFLDLVRPDVAHVHHLLTLSVDLLQQLAARNIPIVYTLHDFWLQCPLFTRLKTDSSLCWSVDLHECARCARSEIDRWNRPNWKESFRIGSQQRSYLTQLRHRERTIKEALEHVDLFLGPSRFLLEEHRKWGVPQEKSRYSPYGYLVTGAETSGANNADGKVRFGYIGSIVYHKGVHVLLEAFRLLTSHRAELHVFGGFYDQQYEEQVRALARGDERIVLHGQFSPQQLAAAYAHFDVLVIPSIWFENSPLTINEAFIHQAPVIAGDVGGMQELVSDRYGALFTVGDAQSLAEKLRLVVEDPEMIAQWKAHLPRVKTIQENVVELEEIFAALLSPESPLSGQETPARSVSREGV